jgi:hypothetical protein
MMVEATYRKPEPKIHREYVLYVRLIDSAGNNILLHWDRFTRFWWPGFVNAKGYATAAVAQAQITRLERRGWEIPKGSTVYEWGWKLRETPLV